MSNKISGQPSRRLGRAIALLLAAGAGLLLLLPLAGAQLWERALAPGSSNNRLVAVAGVATLAANDVWAVGYGAW
ncbi:MAG TPA: hypothetical protein VKY74_27645 [Chloroflexia bacterium]|nr:hypothetical protein [Chloroflexia bacterium]